MTAPATSAPRGDVGAREPDRAVPAAWDSAVTSYYLVLGAATLLLGIGLVMVLSSSTVHALGDSEGASPYGIFVNQARFALIGLPLAWVASRLPARFYKAVAWPALGLAVVLQGLVLLIGDTVKGNQNWLPLPGGMSLQPSEFGKLALAVWLGLVLARKRHLLHRWSHVLVPGVLVGMVLIGLVLVGRDVGTASVLVLVLVVALFVAGVPWYMFLLGLVGAGGLLVAVAVTAGGTRIDRMLAFLDCTGLEKGTCYQTTRGIQALGSGGLTGVGLGQSTEKWDYLPEAHNDFVFAVLGEELGLLGAVLVLALFALLAIGVARVVRRHEDPFVQVTAAGIGAWILGQAVVNVGVVVGLLPVIGLPLPLVSAGGSALLATMLAVGVLVSFARTEPGAAEALAARPGVVRRSLAVVGRSAGWRRG